MEAKPRILVVDDSRSVAVLVAHKLGEHCEVRGVQDGTKALEILAADGNYAAVVLDLLMPGMDGFEVMRNLDMEKWRGRIFVFTARPRFQIESDAMALGAHEVFIKPHDMDRLASCIRRVTEASRPPPEPVQLKDPSTGKPYPFRRAIVRCHICGYDDVSLFDPIPGAYKEDWAAGIYPVFESGAGHAPWDFFRSLVAVCPYCLFASMDPGDFQRAAEDPYPYLPDSKKILARTITTRKRIVSDAGVHEPDFSDPVRDRKLAMVAFELAEKCSNGLILGEKQGAYCMAGTYTTFLGCLTSDLVQRQTLYESAIDHFQNQLKQKKMEPEVAARACYFLVGLFLAIGQMARAKDKIKEVETLYKERAPGDLSEQERAWLLRLEDLWVNGADIKRVREL